MKMTKLTTLFLTATLTLASGSVLAADLQGVGSGQPIQAPPAATATRMPLPKRARLRRMQNRISRQIMLITVISTRAIPTPAVRIPAR